MSQTSADRFPTLDQQHDSGHSKARLAKYAGPKSAIRVELWLNLFEVETRGQGDQDRITNLMRYLLDDALNFYASDVVPKIDTLNWTETRKLLTDRFGIAIRHPLVEANKRYLKASETVQQYFEDKLRLLRLAGLDDEACISMLTDGIPSSYRNHLACSPATNPTEWLKHALRLEANSKFNGTRSQQSHVPKNNRPRTTGPGHTAYFASADQSQQSNATQQRNQSKPRTPCRFCQDAGLTLFHWHRDCTRRQTSNRFLTKQTDAINPRQLSIESPLEQQTYIAESKNLTSGR